MKSKISEPGTIGSRVSAYAAAVGGAPASRVTTPVIGMLPGEGIGPDLLGYARQVLAAVESVSDIDATVEVGGDIGLPAKAASGRELSDEVVAFCHDVFERGGAILAGPGGGRFVYDLRKAFDLFVKFSPLRPCDELASCGRLRPEHVRGVDIVVVRDNVSGIYQGRSTVVESPNAPRRVQHTFSYDEAQVARLVAAGARLAAGRRGRVTVVVKFGGLPELSALWKRVTHDVCDPMNVAVEMIDVDHCAYRLIQQPDAFDVLITPNMIGDVLADLGAVLLGSRGLTYSGNFSAHGAAVYQTNHGSAHDLVGADRANPAAHLMALAMMLRESFGLSAEADRIERALRDVWSQGWRTADIAQASSNGKVLGTQDLTARVVDAIAADESSDTAV
ncbi:MAG: 3-isopropylmalate dehydrogenase [Phycisphaera sp.]|nr:3-isopropylmalate dehydrogenase [Phycisphaera sp.]